jgi:hypothetical protein
MRAQLLRRRWPAFIRAEIQPASPDRWAEILSSRILLRPVDLDRSRRFYRDALSLAVGGAVMGRPR